MCGNVWVRVNLAVAEYEFLTAFFLRIQVFRDTMLCSWVWVPTFSSHLHWLLDYITQNSPNDTMSSHNRRIILFVYAEICHLKFWHVIFWSFTIPALYYLTHSPDCDWRRLRICRYGWEGLFETFFVKFWSSLLDHLVKLSHHIKSSAGILYIGETQSF
jgi:hypothetical protein